jgi:hypothetical protein
MATEPVGIGPKVESIIPMPRQTSMVPVIIANIEHAFNVLENSGDLYDSKTMFVSYPGKRINRVLSDHRR